MKRSDGKVIAIANQKGGCAKTISTYNLAAALVERYGATVCMIDMDPQYSLTASAGIYPRTKGFPKNTTIDLFEKEDALETAYTIDAIDVVDKSGEVKQRPLYIVAAKQELALKILNIPSQEIKTFKKNIKELRRYFDYILLDCAPSLDLLVLTALSCSDGVVIPTKPEFLDIEGLNLILSTIESVKNKKSVPNKELYNPDLKVYGIVASMFRKNVTQHKECVAALAKQFNLLGVVPQAAVVTKETPNGIPCVLGHPNTQASKEFIDIAKKLIEETEKE